jgi:DNA polymerase
VWRYSTHSSTDIWCCAYALDDSEIKLWKPGKPIPEEFIEAAKNPDWIVSSFNDAFERRIEQHIMAPRYGWPLVPLARHRCSQAAALALALSSRTIARDASSIAAMDLAPMAVSGWKT